MKLSIRLQNHGCANHPYWWIVVAANRKNIKGRFLEHVGYWAPRQGLMVDRQITLNLPRIKYWMGNGAVPTPRIQKFLSIWDLMPRPFYVESHLPQKAEQEMSDKEKIKAQRKRKRKERLKLDYINYHAPMAKYKSLQTYHYVRDRTKLREKIHAAQRQNQILRELLLHNQFIKINRVSELSGNAVLDDSQQLLRLEGKLSQAKTELALLERNVKDSSPLQKIEVMKEINILAGKIRAVEQQREPFRVRNSQLTEGENVTKAQLDRQIQYQLITKKIDNMNKQMQRLDKLHQVVTMEEYANYLKVQEPELGPQDAVQIAQSVFMQRGQRGFPPLTKYELHFEEQLNCDPDQILEYDEEVIFQRKSNRAPVVKPDVQVDEIIQEVVQAADIQGDEQQPVKLKKEPEEVVKQKDKKVTMTTLVSEEIGADLESENKFIEKVHQQHLVKFLMMRPDVIVPTNRPVHPFPDLQTYVPEEYYEPISDLNLKVTKIQSLQPNDQLQKYHKKKEYSLKNNTAKGGKRALKRGHQIV